MDAARPADPRSIAHAGLEKSVGGFLRTRLAAASADQAMAEIIDVATTTGDMGTLATAKVGRAAAEALRKSPEARLGVLRAALARVEGGATSSVGFLSQLGYALLDAMDAAMPRQGSNNGAMRAVLEAVGSVERRDTLRTEAVRAMLDAIARQATRAGLREAPYAEFMSQLGQVSPHPVGALNMLDRVNVSSVGDVMRPGWFAVVASGFAMEAEFEGRPELLQQVLAISDPRIEAEAVRQNDAVTLQHLDREKRYAQDLRLSPSGRLALHLATFRVAGNDVPFAPETALVLAHQFTQQRTWSDGAVRKDECHRVLEAAFAEARQGTFMPGTPTAAWMRFHDDVASLGLSPAGRERLERAAFVALAEGRPASSAELRYELYHALETFPAGDVTAAAGPAFEALARLETRGASAALTDPQVADLALGLADGLRRGRPDLADAVLDHAFARLCADPSDRQGRRTLIALGEFELSRTGADQRSAVLRDTLQRFSRLETDEVQKAVLEAARPEPKETAGIEQQGDFVVIGGVKVPRRALQQG